MSDKIRETINRRMQQSDEIQARSLTAIDSLSVEALRELARLYVEEVGYLGDHMPNEREHAKRFPCTGEAYHRCSYMLPHRQGCKAIGGDGNLVGAEEHARSCEATCESDATDEPWCHCNGFDCPDCAMVDELLALLDREGVPA